MNILHNIKKLIKKSDDLGDMFAKVSVESLRQLLELAEQASPKGDTDTSVSKNSVIRYFENKGELPPLRRIIYDSAFYGKIKSIEDVQEIIKPYVVPPAVQRTVDTSVVDIRAKDNRELAMYIYTKLFGHRDMLNVEQTVRDIEEMLNLYMPLSSSGDRDSVIQECINLLKNKLSIEEDHDTKYGLEDSIEYLEQLKNTPLYSNKE